MAPMEFVFKWNEFAIQASTSLWMASKWSQCLHCYICQLFPTFGFRHTINLSSGPFTDHLIYKWKEISKYTCSAMPAPPYTQLLVPEGHGQWDSLNKVLATLLMLPECFLNGKHHNEKHMATHFWNNNQPLYYIFLSHISNIIIVNYL